MGVRQATELGTSELKVDLVVVSPLRRTLETATLAFSDAPFVATELARERISTHTCDWRSTRTDLERDYGHVDFGVMPHDDVMWETKENFPSEDASTLCAQRARDLLCWLRNRPEKRIAVVTHWVFLQHLFKQFPNHPDLGLAFLNAEARAVSLGDTPCPAGGHSDDL